MRCFTSLNTGYITAYSVMDTMEFVSASFFISSIVILQGGAVLGEKVRRKLQLTHTHTYTHPLTHTHTLKTAPAPEWQEPEEKNVKRQQQGINKSIVQIYDLYRFSVIWQDIEYLGSTVYFNKVLLYLVISRDALIWSIVSVLPQIVTCTVYDVTSNTVSFSCQLHSFNRGGCRLVAHQSLASCCMT